MAKLFHKNGDRKDPKSTIWPTIGTRKIGPSKHPQMFFWRLFRGEDNDNWQLDWIVFSSLRIQEFEETEAKAWLITRIVRKCPQKVAFFQNQPNHLIRISEPIYYLFYTYAAIQIFEFSRQKLVTLQLEIIESISGVKIHTLRDVHLQPQNLVIRSVR